jgi:hypothetical protein
MNKFRGKSSRMSFFHREDKRQSSGTLLYTAVCRLAHAKSTVPQAFLINEKLKD